MIHGLGCIMTNDGVEKKVNGGHASNIQCNLKGKVSMMIDGLELAVKEQAEGMGVV